MHIHDYTAGQPVDYLEYNDLHCRWEWTHGHVRGIEDHAFLPLVFIDTTAHSYRPVTTAVELHKVRPAATECRTHAACQGISAEEYRQLDH